MSEISTVPELYGAFGSHAKTIRALFEREFVGLLRDTLNQRIVAEVEVMVKNAK